VRISPAQEAGLLKFVEEGKGFIPLHCASFCFQNSDKIIELVGAQFARHGGEVFSTVITEPEHPLMKDFGGFASWDETYVHRRHNEDRTVLERREQGVQGEGQTSEPWTWVRRYGKGRVFYTAWGHDLRTWNNPGFQNLLERGIRWACGGDPALVPALAFVQAPPGSEEDPNQGQGGPRRRRGGRRGGQGGPAPAGAQGDQSVYGQFLASRFEPPKMVDGGGDIEAFEYDDVGPQVPHYRPRPGERQGRGQRGGGREHHDMQLPVSPEKSITYAMRPEKFEIELYASEADLGPKPVSITWDARGRAWVCETIDYPNEWRENGEGRDRIRICEDTNGDGKADKFTVFAENLSIPYTLAFYRGGVIAQNGGYTIFLKDTNGDDKADVRRTLITGWGMNDTHGAVSNFQYGLDNWIYAMQGYNRSQPKFVDPLGNEVEVPEFRQGFFRFRLDGKDPPTAAELEFLRSTSNNTWGLGISEEGLIFGSTANGNPSVFMPVPNRYYERVGGWSAETLGPIADTPRFSAVTEAVRQVDNFGAYTAGAGHAVYTARTYPKQWWNRTAFVCEPTGHLTGVFVLERDGAGYRSSDPFNLYASHDEWSAPIQAEVGPDGNVWMLDWYNYIVQHNPTPPGFETGVGAAYESDLRDKKYGRIYRIRYVGDDMEPTPPAPANLQTASPDELVAALSHTTKLWRLHAQRLLVERGKIDVVPALIAMVNNRDVDSIGLNVGAIHAMGTLQGLVALAGDGREATAAAAAIRGALTHPSPGVRRIAIATLPASDASLAALFDSNVLNDPDAQVQLAAVLALADLQPSARGAEIIAEKLAGEAAGDRWMVDALISAGAMHGVDFVKALASKFPRPNDGGAEIPDSAVAAVAIVGEHLARGGLDGDQLGVLLKALASADPQLAPPFLASISEFWPDDRRCNCRNRRTTPSLGYSPTFHLIPQRCAAGPLWNAGNTDQLQKQHGDALQARIEDADLSDDQRIAAAESWVRLDPENLDVGRQILGMLTPQTPLPLLAGLLQAAAEDSSAEFAEDLVALYETLSPQGRSAVLNQMFRQPESTTALLDAFADKRIDPGALSLDQVAALRGHAVESIRTRATELLADADASPDPERQKVLTDLHRQSPTSQQRRPRQSCYQALHVCHARRHGRNDLPISRHAVREEGHPEQHHRSQQRREQLPRTR
jgi:putative membrane-bound dehydrogenase-like protein